jgi:hypothetical protein
MMSPQRIKNIPADPPVANNIVETTQTFMVQLSVVGTETPGEYATIDTSIIMGQIPGSQTFWDRVRFEKFLVYGPTELNTATSTAEGYVLQVNVPNGSFAGGTLSLRDAGTFGSRRPCVGFRPGLLERARWYNPSGLDPQFLVARAPTTVSLVVLVTASLRSPAVPIGNN